MTIRTHEPGAEAVQAPRTVVEQAHWFERIAGHLGPAYLRYSFTKGTVQEIDYLVDALGLSPGARVLDVGCGPGRHAHELARRGFVVHGVDISARFVELAREGAPPGATFEHGDARALEFDAVFDLAICLCQGAFGLGTAPDDDGAVIAGIARALRPGGRLALTAFNAYFAVRHFARTAPAEVPSNATSPVLDAATFDADRGVSHEWTEVRDPDGRGLAVELWTGCYTPRELRLLLSAVGLEVERITSVEPGAYGNDPPTTESPEFLVVARRGALSGARPAP